MFLFVRSWETRARIVMEKTHFYPKIVEPLSFLQPPLSAGPAATAWQHCWLDFLVSHQDWRGLAAWVRSMPLRDETVNERGESGVELSCLEQRGLRFCTSYAREVLLQQLGQRGIFCSHDTETFEALLTRLTVCGKLFASDKDLRLEGLGGLEPGPGGARLTAGWRRGTTARSTAADGQSEPLPLLLHQLLHREGPPGPAPAPCREETAWCFLICSGSTCSAMIWRRP